MVANVNPFSYAPPAKGTAAATQHALQKSDETAKSFESMFMAEMMQFMWTDNEVNETFGGGHAEEVWRGMMVQEFGSIASKGGGLGIADQVKAELIKVQEQQGIITAAPTAETKKSIKEMMP